MGLTKKEMAAVDGFRTRIRQAYPGGITRIIVFGSKARGDDKPDSDIDILVVTEADDWRQGDKIRHTGYALDQDIGYKLSIQVISRSHYEYLKRNGFQFIRNCETEGIVV